jgi:methyltransferase (TIGR00027 family)
MFRRRTSKGSRLAASTAEGAAALRAAGAIERDEDIRGADGLAGRFVRVRPTLATVVKVPLLRRCAARLAERYLPGSYWFELARVAHMDEVLKRELADGAEQVVILGAGFDTRPYRFRSELSQALTFEVDQPDLAAVKRQRVKAVLGELPPNVRYVAADLNCDDLAPRLDAAGYRTGARTLVIWSGVTGYLTADAVDSILRWYVRTASPGSAIVFDYIFDEIIRGDPFSYHGARELRERVASAGEPLTFGIRSGSVGCFLRERGFELIDDVQASDLEKRHLVGSDGRVAGRVYGFVGIAQARVSGVRTA